MDKAAEIRNIAIKAQESIKCLKEWEAEMKQKEEMTKNTQRSNEFHPPIRSTTEFQQVSELQKMSAMCISDDNKASELAQLRAEAIEFKNKGNTFVKMKEYESAIKMYSRAIELYNDDPIFYSNRSQCYLNMEKYQECVDDTIKAVTLDPKSTKALYRQMTAYEKLGEDLKALRSCRQWLELEPEDQTCKNSYDRILNRILEAEKKKDKEKIRWSRFGSDSKVADFVTKPPNTRSKRPLKKIAVDLRKVIEPLPEALIDRIFGNNTGENSVLETDSKLFKPNFLTQQKRPSNQKVTEKQNETNENVKAADEKKELKIEEIEAISSQLTVTPSSGPKFFAIWKELSDIQRFIYLKNIATQNLPIGELLGAQLDSEMLSQLIDIIHKYFNTYNVPCLRLLSDLGNNSELKVLAMFLDDDDKSKLNELLIGLAASGDNELNNLILAVKKSFQL